MELVIDANILLASLVKDAITRELMLDPRLTLVAPEHLLSETSNLLKKSSSLRKRIGLPHQELQLLFEVLTQEIQTKPHAEYKLRMKEAITIAPHKEDAPYMAVALALNMPIWSNDKGMHAQTRVRVYTTRRVLKILEGL